MNDYKLTPKESDLLKVIKNEIDFAQDTPSLKPTMDTLDSNIKSSEGLLKSLGMSDELSEIKANTTYQSTMIEAEKKNVKVRTFDDLLRDANERVQDNVDFSDIFTPEELSANLDVIEKLNADFNAIHRLDSIDWAI